MMRQYAPAITLLLLIFAALLPRFSPVFPHPGITGINATPLVASLAERLAPPGLVFRPGSQPEIAVEGVASDGAVVWSGLLSNAVAPDLQGYAGPVEMLVGIGSSGYVTGVSILRHSETPTFVTGIEDAWFLDQFKGKSLEDPLKPGTDFDGITQATVTVEAISAGIRRCLQFAAGSPQTRSAAPTDSHQSWRPWIALLGAFLIALAAPFIPRRLSDSAHALFIGFMGILFLSFGHLQMFLRDPASILRLPTFWLVFFTAALTLLLIKPRGYCRHLCPCGRLQDALAGAAPQPVIEDVAPDPDPGDGLPRGLGRTLFWSGLIALAFVPGFPGERLELFAPLFTLRPDAFGILLIVAAAAGSLLTRRFYCRTLCPLDPFFTDLESVRGRLLRRPGPADPKPDSEGTP